MKRDMDKLLASNWRLSGWQTFSINNSIEANVCLVNEEVPVLVLGGQFTDHTSTQHPEGMGRVWA